MDSLSKVKTGDTLFFSNNTATGFILKTGTSSLWNHVGIAVRLLNGKVSTDYRGNLYVYDINSGTRYDPIFKKEVTGASFVSIETMKKKYNLISYRSIIDNLRSNENFIEKVNTFVTDNLGCKFTSGLFAFISAWWNFDCLFQTQNSSDKKDKFCTQLVIDFYMYCFDTTIDNLFTSNAPSESRLFSPELMSISDAPCYENHITNVYKTPCDLLTIILLPVIFVLLLLLVLWYLLP